MNNTSNVYQLKFYTVNIKHANLAKLANQKRVITWNRSSFIALPYVKHFITSSLDSY